MKRKGFTLVELLVVIAIIALLMGILMPALAKVKSLAYRLICGTHLAGIGKGISLYAADSKDRFPRAAHTRNMGGTVYQPTWVTTGLIPNWSAPTAFDAYSPSNTVTITASLYLLVKYAEVEPSLFICRGDAGSSEFQLSDFPLSADVQSPADAWDFGTNPGMHCSYAYHRPYGGGNTDAGYPLRGTLSGGTPVCADRNPAQDKNAAGVYLGGVMAGESAPEWDSSRRELMDPDKTGSAAAHAREGQNVLFVDGHVDFARLPNVGLTQDHIYKNWNARLPSSEQVRQGMTRPYTGNTQSEKDAYLVGESNEYGSTYARFLYTGTDF